MELTCILSVFVGTVVFAVQTHALIWEADMPNLLKQCYEEHTHDLTSELPGQDVHTYCLGKYIWQIPNVQGKFNMTENEINLIKSAYRDFQQNLHSARRHKRQANRALRRELRVLSDEERRSFFNALNKLKENKVRLQCKCILVYLFLLSLIWYHPVSLGFVYSDNFVWIFEVLITVLWCLGQSPQE